jgi:hypothetical protein
VALMKTRGLRMKQAAVLCQPAAAKWPRRSLSRKLPGIRSHHLMRLV